MQLPGRRLVWNALSSEPVGNSADHWPSGCGGQWHVGPWGSAGLQPEGRPCLSAQRVKQPRVDSGFGPRPFSRKPIISPSPP